VTRNEIYSLIATGDIFVDLLSALLPELENVTVWLEKPLQPDGLNAGSSAGERSALRAGEALGLGRQRLDRC